ncbi:unnamed protein product [Pylaiella littoralis]
MEPVRSQSLRCNEDVREGRIAGVSRSGNGREGRLAATNTSSSVKPGRSKGEGGQAIAWQTMSFEKLESSKANSSSSTSPETDPGTAYVFPFFRDDEEGQDGRQEDGGGGGAPDEDDVASVGGQQGAVGREGVRVLLRTASDRAAASKLSATADNGGLDYRNPLFHVASGNAEKAVASLFPEDGQAESCGSEINGHNPMFRRSASLNGRPRPKVNRDIRRASSTLSADGSKAAAEEAAAAAAAAEEKQAKKKKEKMKKALYEHVGRMNVGPFLVDDGDKEGVGHGGFRLDTFARNEGEAGGRAHFKFVFTLTDAAAPSEGEDEDAKKLRPVVDAIHNRSTGKLRVQVNDGRKLIAEENAAVNIPLVNVGVALFNPKTMAKGHHLYTLSLNGRTLFSVLA